MPKEWGWYLNHTLDSKSYVLNENGQVATATLKNTGERLLHIYGFGIEFEWLREIGHWYSSKCGIFLPTKEETELPIVGFSIPVDLKPGTYKYRVGVQTESYRLKMTRVEAEWENHHIVWGDKERKIEITHHPDRDYQIFVSHSNHSLDKKIMKTLTTLLSNNGIKYFVAEETPKYGEILWKKIRRGIFTADRVIILWTKYAAKSGDVREELGVTLGARKRFIPVIEKNVKAKGSLIGTEYIRLNRDKDKDIFVKLTEELIKFSEEKAKRRKKRKPIVETPF